LHDPVEVDVESDNHQPVRANGEGGPSHQRVSGTRAKPGTAGQCEPGEHLLKNRPAEPSLFSYKSFDFHAKCRGMKWENISELVEDFDVNTMGYLWTLQGEVIREQAGAFRTK